MLEVKVVLRHAVTGEVSEIASMTITNDGTGDHHYGHYDVAASERLPPPARGTFLFKGKVKDHDPHSGVWRLVAKAIKGLKP